ncbi:ATP-binding protein [Vibrio fluvialis]|uniref:ATP-binding protein n=1 Tax=Vibrio fluvialis TaxID=676 RepID=UPI00192AE843|nr:ATP-binding protein [Vibrio fluvialis]MBL4238177.1 ATP-binding protein [Vibrio fluvialis]MBL4264972.1 ATP-binding protein [Vibrio fluvialis]MBL4270340.1 ATP-binding protein [Vibrio fluvialis]MBL4272370.1 ATP-binding protein [Vibrio fluvialis]MBO1439493.1 ATP-binding protein [Vibrio fluvialis]
MRAVSKLLLLLCWCVAFPALAEWEYDQVDLIPKASERVLQLENEVSALPEPLFMSRSDQQKVNILLHQAISAQQDTVEQFQTYLGNYRHQSDELNWFNLQQTYLSLASLSRSKQHLLSLTDSFTHDQYTGFGPDGVKQFQVEWKQMQLNLEYLMLFQIRSFESMLGDLLISPVPFIWSICKVLLIYFVLIGWLRNSKHLIDLFWQSYLKDKQSPSLLARVIWYISSANKAIAWLIAITLSLQVLSAIKSLQHLVYLEIFIWWIWGGSIAVSLILEFTYRSSHTSNKALIALRLSTIRRIVWTVIITGVVLQLSMRTLGKGTIYTWILTTMYLWFLLMIISVLSLWRERIFAVVEKTPDKPLWVMWAMGKKNTLLLRIPATLVAMVWLTINGIERRLIAALSNYTFFSQALAYLFRIEAAKQTTNIAADQNYVRVRGDETFEYILPGSFDSVLVDYASEEMKQLSRYLLTDSPAICVVTGERGVGTTTLLYKILNKVKNAEPLYLSCPYSGYNELLSLLALSLGLDEDATEVQILAYLRKSEQTYLIAVDNAQRLVKPMVGGLSSLMRLTNLLRRSKKNHRVVMALEKSSWRFVDRARGERLLFDWVTVLPRWSEKQLAELLDSRINPDVEHPVSFDGLVVPKQWGQEESSDEERAKQGFYRILWHYSDGNPTVALRFFRRSLNRNKETQQVVVRLFHTPESQELEKMPKPMLAVLRSIVQLEIASPEELSECTQLTVPEVIGIMRYFESRGYIEWAEDKTRVSDHWYRTITNVLDRQHLLVK